MVTHPKATPDPHALACVLEAIADLNADVLEALVITARLRPAWFPLPRRLIAEFSRLMVAQCSERARCGVFLADAGFNDAVRWVRVVSDAALEEVPNPPPSWIPAGHEVILAHSVVMVAWHTVHAVPLLASVLLGMSEEVVRMFAKLSIADLGSIARSRFDWIRPRWSDRADIWASIVATGGPGLDAKPMTVLRCLKASATDSHRLLSATTLE